MVLVPQSIPARSPRDPRAIRSPRDPPRDPRAIPPWQVLDMLKAFLTWQVLVQSSIGKNELDRTSSAEFELHGTSFVKTGRASSNTAGQPSASNGVAGDGVPSTALPKRPEQSYTSDLEA